MKDKKKGPEIRKPAGPMQAAEAAHVLYSKIREIKSQESLLLFLFVESQKNIILEPMLDAIWEFMEFLKTDGYHIVSGKKVFCFPFGKMAELSKLK